MLQQAQAKFHVQSQHTSSSSSSLAHPPRWIQSNAEKIPLDDDCVDVVCSTSAFHFFQDRDKALQEMYRILKEPRATTTTTTDSPSIISVGSTSLIITDWCADYFLVRLYHTGTFELLRWSWPSSVANLEDSSSSSSSRKSAVSSSSSSMFWSRTWTWSTSVWKELTEGESPALMYSLGRA